jgi:hypothetical protein
VEGNRLGVLNGDCGEESFEKYMDISNKFCLNLKELIKNLSLTTYPGSMEYSITSPSYFVHPLLDLGITLLHLHLS